MTDSNSKLVQPVIDCTLPTAFLLMVLNLARYAAQIVKWRSVPRHLGIALAALACALALVPQTRAQAPCCSITSIDSHAELVNAKENTTARTFTFKVTNPKLLASLKVGQGVYANFKTNQVSLDGRTACCAIVTPPSSAPQAAGALPTGGSSGSSGDKSGTPSVTKVTGVAFNPRIELLAQGNGWQLRRITGVFNGQTMAIEAYRLNGKTGIEGSNLPPEYKQALGKVAQSLPPEQATFLVPASIIKEWELKKGRHYESWVSSAYQCATDSEETVSGNLPSQQFSNTLNVRKPFSVGSDSSVSASGTVELQAPLSGDFAVEAEMFHSKCLGTYRPKAFTVRGNISSGATLTVDLQKIKAKGDFSTPEVSVPLLAAVIPVGADMAIEADVSLFALGGVKLNATVTLDAKFSATAQTTGSSLQLHCDGHGCSSSGSADAKFRASDSFSLRGQGVRAQVQPYVFGGIELNLEEGKLGKAQLGPYPYVIADAWGYYGTDCAVAPPNSRLPGTLTKTADRTPLSALTLDLDAGMEIHYKVKSPGIDKEGHFGDVFPRTHIPNAFWDVLGNSSALSPVLSGEEQPPALQPATYKVRMHPCYPYTETVIYRVGWSGADSSQGQSKAIGTAVVAHDLGAPTGAATDVSGSPQKDVQVKHTWPATGAFVIEARPVRDSHGRQFPSEASTFPVQVQPPSKSGTKATGGGQPQL